MCEDEMNDDEKNNVFEKNTEKNQHFSIPLK